MREESQNKQALFTSFAMICQEMSSTSSIIDPCQEY